MPSIARENSELDALPMKGRVIYMSQDFVKVNGRLVSVVGDEGTTHTGNYSGGAGTVSDGYEGPGDVVPPPAGSEGETPPPPPPNLHFERKWKVVEGKPYVTINGKAVAVVGSKTNCSHRITTGTNFVNIK